MLRSNSEMESFAIQCPAPRSYAHGGERNARTTLGVRLIRESIVMSLVILLGACATTFEPPAPLDDSTLRERATTVVKGGIRVSATVPSMEESKAIFGIDLSESNIQPLWLEVENDTDTRMWLLPTGVDPEYFSPLEVAFGYRAPFSDAANSQLDEHIERLSFRSLIDLRSTTSGFVYTNRDEVVKLVNVDLISVGWAKNFTLLVPIPDREIRDDHWERVFAIIAESKPVQIEDGSRLRELLEQLPCCTSSEAGDQGEPLNIVLIGELEDMLPAFTRQNYRYAAVTPRFVFGRPQDSSGRKRAQWTAAQPHVTRFWLTTLRYRGKSVWVGQVSTPLGGRFAVATDNETGPPLDPDVDEARNDMVQDMILSQSLAKIGWVKGVGRVKASEPRTIPGGGTYHTDGLRAVLLFQQKPVSVAEIEFFEWERLMDHDRRQLDMVESN